MSNEQLEARRNQPPALYMFYGLLNIDVLANVLPFEGELDNGTY